jgi:probable addiction module antidote protein
VLEDGDTELVAAALGDIARSKGRTQLARAAGLGRESLYKALSAQGNPEFATVLKVVHALGMRLTATPIAERPGKRARPRLSRATAAANVGG